MWDLSLYFVGWGILAWRLWATTRRLGKLEVEHTNVSRVATTLVHYHGVVDPDGDRVLAAPVASLPPHTLLLTAVVGGGGDDGEGPIAVMAVRRREGPPRGRKRRPVEEPSGGLPGELIPVGAPARVAAA